MKKKPKNDINQQELSFGSKNQLILKNNKIENELNGDLIKENFKKNFYERTNISLEIDL